MLTVEQLKDQIRLTFSDEVIHVEQHQKERRTPGDRRHTRHHVDSWPMAKKRFGFIVSELGHAWVNLPKELMTDQMRVSERVADRLKYPLSFVMLVGVFAFFTVVSSIVIGFGATMAGYF